MEDQLKDAPNSVNKVDPAELYARMVDQNGQLRPLVEVLGLQGSKTASIVDLMENGTIFDQPLDSDSLLALSLYFGARLNAIKDMTQFNMDRTDEINNIVKSVIQLCQALDASILQNDTTLKSVIRKLQIQNVKLNEKLNDDVLPRMEELVKVNKALSDRLESLEKQLTPDPRGTQTLGDKTPSKNQGIPGKDVPGV